MPRPRKAVAVACIALILVAAVVPLGGVALDWCVVPTIFVVLPEVAHATLFAEAPCCDASAITCLCAVDFRGPPSAPLA